MIRKLLFLSVVSLPIGLSQFPDSLAKLRGPPHARYSTQGGHQLRNLGDNEGKTYNKIDFARPFSGDIKEPAPQPAEEATQPRPKSIIIGNGGEPYQDARYYKSRSAHGRRNSCRNRNRISLSGIK